MTDTHILNTAKSFRYFFMRKLLFLFILSQCFLLSGFYFQRGNQNVEYDNPALYPQVLLTFLGVQYPSENKTATEHVLNDYLKLHQNILVSYEWVPLHEYPCILKKRIRSNSLDDVFMFSLGSRYQIPEGLLVDLANLPTLAAYRQQVLAQMRNGDAVPYVTTSLGAFGLFCNLNMLERNRLKVPQTLDEFLAACETFSRTGLIPLAVTRECLRALLIARAFEPAAFGNADAFFHSLNTDEAFLRRTLLNGFLFLVLLRDRGYFDVDGLIQIRENMPGMSFWAGEQPFMIGGSWFSPVLGKAQPAFRFSVFPLPATSQGAVAVLGLDTPLSVSSRGEHVPQAVQLVEGLTSPESIRVFNDGQGCFSPLKDAPLPADKAVHPLWKSMDAGRGIFHSDIRLHHDLWRWLDSGIELILSGASAEEATESVIQALHDARQEEGKQL